LNRPPLNPFFNTMDTNPIEKKGYTEKKYYPIKIVCVVDEYNETATPLIQAIRDYALEKGVIFQTRIYDSSKRSEERLYIERLPAFQAYNKKAYLKTFYPNTRPIQHIDELIHEQMVKEERRNMKRFPKLSSVIAWIKTLLRRKTAKEKYEDEQIRIRPKMEKDMKPLPISEWN